MIVRRTRRSSSRRLFSYFDCLLRGRNKRRKRKGETGLSEAAEILEDRTLLCGFDLIQITDTTDGAGASRASITDDGTHIVFTSALDLTGDNADGNQQIFLFNNADNSLIQITNTTVALHEFLLPSINSDGSRIAFESISDLTGNNPDGNREIYLYDNATSSLIQVTDSTAGRNHRPSINGDGTLISFVSTSDLTGANSDGNNELFLFDVNASSITQLTDTTQGVGVPGASISGDGSRVVFDSDRDFTGDNSDGNIEIFLFDIKSNSFAQITNSTVGISLGGSINGDGTRIAFRSVSDLTGGNADGNLEIFFYVSNTNDLTQLTDTTNGENTSNSINSDGTRIAFQSTSDQMEGNSDGNRDIYLFNTQGSNKFTQITDTTEGINLFQTMNHDGSLIAFVSDRNLTGENADQNRELFLMNTAPECPDEHEKNDTMATATVLGSSPNVILRDLTIEALSDVDFFKYTATESGLLSVNAFFDGSVGDIDLQVRDVNGNIIATGIQSNILAGLDSEQFIVPVVTQQEYWIEVFTPLPDLTSYDLEIENFATPIPSGVHLDPDSDTGLMKNDNNTADNFPRYLIQANLTDFENIGITVLAPTQAIAGTTAGAAVEIFITNSTTGVTASGFARQIGASTILFDFTPVAPLGDGVYFVAAAVRMFDGQSPVNATGRSQLSEPLRMTVDTTAPLSSPPELLDSSDTGMIDSDNVTNKMSPAFQGTAEPNAIVRVLANGVVVGQGVVGSNGSWEVTIDSLANGHYDITTEIEDTAGNISNRSPIKEIWIDTVKPNAPFLDLITDSGRHNTDNITNVNRPTFDINVDDTPNGGLNPFPNDVKYRVYLRPGDASGEILIFDSWMANGNMFVTGGSFTHTFSQTLNDPAGVPFADGVYELKLEVEDRAGNLSHDFLLGMTVDTIVPPKMFGDGVNEDGLHPDSDSGVAGYPNLIVDRITNDSTPTLFGRAEADSIVRLYVVTAGGPVQIGQTVANPLDGNLAFPDGEWDITSTFDLNDPILALGLDGQRTLLITAEDLAGNLSQSMSLDIFIDTQGPRVFDPDGAGPQQAIQVVTNGVPNATFDLFDIKPTLGPTPRTDGLLINISDLPDRVATFLYDALQEGVPSHVENPGHFMLTGDTVLNVAIARITVVQQPSLLIDSTPIPADAPPSSPVIPTDVIPAVAPLVTITVTTTADVVDPSDGLISLREAIISANSTPGPDTISVPAGTYTLSIGGTGENAAATGDLDITDDLTIIGDGAATTSIDAAGIDRVFDVVGAFAVNFSDVTIQNGYAPDGRFSDLLGGGGIRSNGTLTLDGVIVRDNTAGTFRPGGGILNDGGPLTINDSTITGNEAGRSGGGIYNLSGLLGINDSTITGNRAGNNGGGGIYYSYAAGDLTIANSIIDGNEATSSGGGGIKGFGNNFTITDSSISNNTDGGGIQFSLLGSGGSGIIANSIISGNVGNIGGLAVGGDKQRGGGSLAITDSIVNDNISGGGMYLDVTTTITNSTISGNQANFTGGGIDQSRELTITGSTISGNTTASDGGGIWVGGTLTLIDSSISDNRAAGDGGGIFQEGTSVTLTGSILSGNSADEDGGAIYNESGTVSLTNSTVSGNTAGDHGGGILNGDSLDLDYVTITGNSADSDAEGFGDGGGIFNEVGEIVNLHGTIVAGNTDTGGEAPDVSGVLNSQGFNLIQDTTGATLGGDLTGNISGQDPLLGSLADNGGPTFTHTLSPSSPAIDAADAGNFLATDQRGISRPQDAGPDIGAFEATFATAYILLEFFEPLQDDRYTLTLRDTLTDPAGNALDGNSNANQPSNGPTFPSGDLTPGGDFVARFTVDSRAEIGTWGQSGIFIDANGNYLFDAPVAGGINHDVSRDLVFDIGIQTDNIFAGQFKPAGAILTNGYDRIGAYGLIGGTYRFLLDFDDNGRIDAGETIVSNVQVNAFPVSGNFDGNALNGDEIGLFDGASWYFDTTGDNLLDTTIGGGLRGLPITGDFDGDGLVDLGTHIASSNAFFFSLSSGGGSLLNANSNTSDTFVWGFPGVLERPFSNGDFNLDGIDDFGLTTPSQDGTDGELEWYIIVSDHGLQYFPDNQGSGGFGGAPAPGIADIFEPFSPTPLGNDIFTLYNGTFSAAVVGNFDPPNSLTSSTEFLPLTSTTDTTPTLEWNSVNSASEYELLLYNVDLGQQVAHAILDATSYRATVAAGNNYQAFVRPVNNYDETGSWSNPYYFSIDGLIAPEITSPANTTGDATPTIAWTTIAGASSYNVLVYSLSVGQEVARSFGQVGTDFTPTTPLPGAGDYQVYVQAADASGASSWRKHVFEMTASVASLPGAPIVTSPSGTENDSTPTIAWTAGENASSHEMLIYNIATGQEVANETGLVGTSFTIDTPLAVSGTHQIYLRAVNDLGNSGWNTPFTFELVLNGNEAPTAPALISPTVSTGEFTPTFAWTASDNADSYELLVYHIETGQQVFWQKNLTTTSYTPSSLLPGTGHYQVFLRATNSFGTSGWSRATTFEIAMLDELIEEVPDNETRSAETETASTEELDAVMAEWSQTDWWQEPTSDD